MFRKGNATRKEICIETEKEREKGRELERQQRRVSSVERERGRLKGRECTEERGKG